LDIFHYSVYCALWESEIEMVICDMVSSVR
jgi:hypothetical protein